MFLLFPLDGARWLGGDVVDDAVYASDFVADAAAHFVEHFPWEAEVVSGHAIRGCDGTDTYGVVIGSFITLHADGTDRCREDGEGLPDGIVEAMLMDDISHDEVRTAQDIAKLAQNGTDAVLIGETLMRATDKKAMLENLKNGTTI